jgi:prolyl-tRNA synthetase
MYQRALDFRDANTHRVDTWEEFQKVFEGEGGGGFVLAHWDGTTETEEAIADKTKATLRCILLEPLHPDDEKPGKCIFSGKPSSRRVVFAKAY